MAKRHTYFILTLGAFTALSGCTTLLGSFELTEAPDATVEGGSLPDVQNERPFVPDTGPFPHETGPLPDVAETAPPKTSLGLKCSRDLECASNHCVNEVCCSEGVCPACKRCNENGKCDGNVEQNKDDGRCLGDTDAGLTSGDMTCNGTGQCVRKLGRPCEISGQCTSAPGGSPTCSENGVCCIQAKCGACQFCRPNDGTGTPGACANVAIGSDPRKECKGGFQCDGAGQCAVRCVCRIADTGAVGSTPCDNIEDGKSEATSSQDCKQGYYCAGSAPQAGDAGQKCLLRAKGTPGAGCLGDYQCASGKCDLVKNQCT